MYKTFIYITIDETIIFPVALAVQIGRKILLISKSEQQLKFLIPYTTPTICVGHKTYMFMFDIYNPFTTFQDMLVLPFDQDEVPSTPKTPNPKIKTRVDRKFPSTFRQNNLQYC